MKKIFIIVFFLMLFFSANTVSAYDDYNLTNSIKSFSSDEIEKIHTLLSACADVMEFDSANPDFDALMQYILHSHNNFRIITDINPKAVEGTSQLRHDNISLVGGEFVDYIVENIFSLEPEHPTVNALIPRGFCYSGGYYYYVEQFTYYSTEVLDIEAIYSLGGERYYVVFTDIYTEDNKSSPEYSYAVIKTGGDYGYQVLRIGMGLEPLSEDEVLAYAPDSGYQTIPDTPVPDTGHETPYHIPVLLVTIFFGTAALIIGLIIIIKETRNR